MPDEAVIRSSKFGAEIGSAWSPLALLDRVAPLGPTERVIGEANVSTSGAGRPFGGRWGFVRLTDKRLLLNEMRALLGNTVTQIPRRAVLDMRLEEHSLPRGSRRIMLRLRTSTGEERLQVRFRSKPVQHLSWLAQGLTQLVNHRGATDEWLTELNRWLLMSDD